MVKLRNRIARLEQREGFDATGPIPFLIIDRVIAGTISDWELERWRPSFDRIIADVDAGMARQAGWIATDNAP